jgi:hypothetical protein
MIPENTWKLSLTSVAAPVFNIFYLLIKFSFRQLEITEKYICQNTVTLTARRLVI